MNSSDKYILITESHDLDAGPVHSGEEIHEEGEDASLRALESQGISILDEKEHGTNEEPLEQFSRELLSEGGIEIVSGDEAEDEAYL